jgi:teichuronic acid biosynthesis glycosyltransferase TuaC
MRALVVTNMWPSDQDPALGVFVRDQVQALRALDGVEVDVFDFPPGGYARAIRALRRAHRGKDYDVIHAHFGLTAWVALTLRGAPHGVTLHGTDVRHRRSGLITRAALPLLDLVATVSADLAGELRGAGSKRQVAVLPCGVDMTRFRRLPRAAVRAQLGLDPAEPCLLFPADPARPAKRHDRAMQVADGVRLLSLGGVAPAAVPLWVNAANAVIVPSEREGFGLAVLEALACDVPVAATAVGIHPVALGDVAGTLCAEFDVDTWRAALSAHLAQADPRIAGRARAAMFSADRMARRVAAAWSDLSGVPVYSLSEAPPNGAVVT